MEYEIVVAYCSKNRGIGKDGKLPWDLPRDLEHFAHITTQAPEGYRNAIIMGRNTWLSIPSVRRPLKNRVNMVLTTHPKEYYEYGSLDDALDSLKGEGKCIHKVFIIGGERVYREALNDSRCVRIHLTEIYQPFECDTFFPEINTKVFGVMNISDMHIQNEICFRFFILERLTIRSEKSSSSTVRV